MNNVLDEVVNVLDAKTQEDELERVMSQSCDGVTNAFFKNNIVHVNGLHSNVGSCKRI